MDLTENIALGLLKEAEKYSLPKLKEICERFIEENIRIDNVIELVNMAEQYEAPGLRQSALKFMLSNLDVIFAEQDIKRLKSSTILELIKLRP